MPTNPADRLAEIAQREQHATKGPWKSDGEEEPQVYAGACQLCSVLAGECVRVSEFDKFRSLRRRNAEFIAHAREDIPWLLAELRTLQQQLARYQQFIVAHGECHSEYCGDDPSLPRDKRMKFINKHREICTCGAEAIHTEAQRAALTAEREPEQEMK